ncbi:MAG: M23 family metallopeptidase [Antricoccus sp.]
MSEHRRHDRGSATGQTDRPTVAQSLLPTTSLPFNRITAWLAGLAIGGVLLLVLGIPLPSSATRSTTAYSADGVGGETVTGLSEDGAADAARELSAAEATNRLDQLRATRGTRGETTAVWVNPVPGAPYTSCFCMRWGTMHSGIDLAAPSGTPMYSVGDGVVLKAGPASGFGLAIYIQHVNGDVTVYGHMFVMDVKTGDIVRAGQQIAEVGANGQSTGPHLHLEVHQGGIDGTKIDPLPWLAARGVIIS